MRATETKEFLATHINILKSLVATGLTGFFGMGISQGQITMTIDVTSPTSFSITASGTITGVKPTRGDTNILWIDIPTTADQTLGRSGTFSIGSQNPNSSFIGYTNPPYDAPIQIRYPSALSSGDVVNFNGTLTMSTAHGLTNAVLDGASIYWGREAASSLANFGEGTFQGTVTTPSSSIPALQITKNGAGVELNWTGSAVLETSPDLSPNSWTPLANATSPYTPALSHKAFFRLRN